MQAHKQTEFTAIPNREPLLKELKAFERFLKGETEAFDNGEHHRGDFETLETVEILIETVENEYQ